MERAGIVDYSRQEEMVNHFYNRSRTRLHNHQFSIIGCGGIGFWFAIHAALMGIDKFILVDADNFDTTNLSRLPVEQQWVGKPKIVALKHIIRKMRPDISVLTIRKYFNPDTDMDLLENVNNGYGIKHIIVDCTDNAITQKKLYTACQSRNILYEKIGYEGFNVGSYSNYDVWIENENEYQTGYRTSRANSMSSSFAAIVGLMKILSNNKNDIDINMLKLIEGNNQDEEVS